MNKTFLYKLASLLSILSMIFTFAQPQRVYACSCAYEPGLTAKKQVRANLEREHHEIVFVGTVTELSYRQGSVSGHEDVSVTFDLNRVYKGDAASQFTLFTSSQESACGYGFAEGVEYLVFVGDDSMDGTWNSGLCNGNEANPSADLLAVLGEGNPPSQEVEVVDGEGEVIEPTSEAGMNFNLLWLLPALLVLGGGTAVFLRRRKNKGSLVTLVLLVALMSACTSPGEDEIEPNAAADLPSALIDRSWVLTAAGSPADDMFLPEEPPTLTFTAVPDPNGEDGLSFEGFSGCNSLFGSYIEADDQLTMLVGQTEQDCGSDLMNFEQYMINILRSQPTYQMTAEGGNTFLTLQVGDDMGQRLIFTDRGQG